MATEEFDIENDQGLSGMELVKCFNSELNSMCETKPPVSKAKMNSVTKSAMKAHRMYKHVVHCVEKFIQKCRPEYKVPGLYVMDSIVRQSRHYFPNEKDVFAPRFSKNIQTTFKNLLKCRVVEIPKLVRVLNLWQKNGIYSPSVIQPLLGMVAPRPGSHSSNSKSGSKHDPSMNAAEVVAANAVAIIQQQQTHIQALLQQQAQQQLANLSPNLLQNIQSLQSLLSNANIVTPITAPAISANASMSIPLSSTLEKLKEAASSVLGLTGSTASGTAHSSSMADLEPAQEFKPKLKPHQLQHINQFLEQQETAQNHEYINDVQTTGVPPPPPPPPPPVPSSDSQQRRMERNLREFEREHKISHKRSSHDPWSEKRSRHSGKLLHKERIEQISDDEGGVDMDVGTPSPPIFEDTTRSFLDDFDYGDDQGEDERIEEQKRRVTQERNRVAKLSERNVIRFSSPTSVSPQLPMPMRPSFQPPQPIHPNQQPNPIHDDKIGDSIPTISRIQLGPSKQSPERTRPPSFIPNVIPMNPPPNQSIPPVRLPWIDPSLRPPPGLPMHAFPRPMLPTLPPGLPSRHLFPPPPFITPQQQRPPFSLPPPRHPFHPHTDFVPPTRPPVPQDNYPAHRADYPPKDVYHTRERDVYSSSGPRISSPICDNSDSPRGAFSRWRNTPSPPPEPRERDKKRQRFRRDSKDPPYEYEERRRYRSRSRSPDRDKDRERRRKRHNSYSPIERREKNKRRDKSRSPREKRKRRESEIKERDRTRITKDTESSYQSPPSKWKALETIEFSSSVKEQEGEKLQEIHKVNLRKENDKEKKHSFSLAKVKCISVLSSTIWVQVKKVAPNSERIIREKCEEFGSIVSFDLIPSRGCAYVEMETRESADKLVNVEREIKLGGINSKLVYAPGKGVKDDNFKQHWDSTHGITYLPWSIVTDKGIDLSELQEGGILDPDTLPPGVVVPEKKMYNPNIPPIFMPLPPMIPTFPPPPLTPSAAAIIPPTQSSFPGPPSVGLLPLPIPNSQPSNTPVLLNMPITSDVNQLNDHTMITASSPAASTDSTESINNANERNISTLTAPHVNTPERHPVPPTGPFPYLPKEFGHNPRLNIRPQSENEIEQFHNPPPFFAPPRPHRPPRPMFPPSPEFRAPPPGPIDPRFRQPRFPNMRPPSLPHPDHRFRIPPPIHMRGPPNMPHEFRVPPPRIHPPPIRHEFKVPALPAELKDNHITDSNNIETTAFPRPSTPPGYDKGPQKSEQSDTPTSSLEKDNSLAPPPTGRSPRDVSPTKTPEDSSSENTDLSISRPNKPLVAEYSGIYSPHSDDGSGEASEQKAQKSSPKT
ncbi:Protein SCAF8-like [Oopsacas minuta]|uniref:Protein SCAF8-like n=1 Tax=Oopsacas minuta TaxID=111878 RepID=A0AAV7KH19_9METZ|nr:Protein SCAF8-like [Oopsacas minuta]